MHTLAVELQEVLDQYLRLTEDIQLVFRVAESQDPQTLIVSIVEHQSCFMRIQQLDARVLKLSENLERCQKELDSMDYKKIESFFCAIKTQALKILELCRLLEPKVQSRRDQLAKELTEIKNGSRYLKVLHPTPANFPKFVDSTC
jgi:hypothetical protein